jgi:hypothetical protein
MRVSGAGDVLDAPYEGVVEAHGYADDAPAPAVHQHLVEAPELDLVALGVDVQGPAGGGGREALVEEVHRVALEEDVGDRAVADVDELVALGIDDEYGVELEGGEVEGELVVEVPELPVGQEAAEPALAGEEVGLEHHLLLRVVDVVDDEEARLLALVLDGGVHRLGRGVVEGEDREPSLEEGYEHVGEGDLGGYPLEAG